MHIPDRHSDGIVIASGNCVIRGDLHRSDFGGTDKNETGNWSEESDGVYTTTRTAKIAGDRHYATLKLSTWSSAQQSDAYAIRESGAVLAYSSIVTDKTAYTAGGAIKVTVTLKDSYENLVGGQRDAINLAIQLPNTKAESIAWNEDQKGIYTAAYSPSRRLPPRYPG